MTTLAFDTYAFIRKLKESGINSSESATRQDVRESELKLELKIAETKAELVRWIIGAGFLQTALIAGLLLKLSAGI